MKRILLGALFLLGAISCDGDYKKRSELCESGGTLYGSKWCDEGANSGFTTSDFDRIQELKSKADNCFQNPSPLTGSDRGPVLRNAGDLVTALDRVDEAIIWSYVVGRCWDKNDPSKNFTDVELRQKVKEFMDARYVGDKDEFTKWYPNCDLHIQLRPYTPALPYGIAGCSPDIVVGGNARIPTGSINVAAKIHFNAFYDEREFHAPRATTPNYVQAEKAIEYAQEMLSHKTIRHEIKAASPAINQSITVDTVAATNWKHQDWPTTVFWSKRSTRINLETPIVIAALTHIIKGNAGNRT